ncbi:MAG: hypothetical protein QM302_08735 [Acidobacteriota bacterium]|nr:hypothetical protein [Acidobacteriota bacterium]
MEDLSVGLMAEALLSEVYKMQDGDSWSTTELARKLFAGSPTVDDREAMASVDRMLRSRARAEGIHLEWEPEWVVRFAEIPALTMMSIGWESDGGVEVGEVVRESIAFARWQHAAHLETRRVSRAQGEPDDDNIVEIRPVYYDVDRGESLSEWTRNLRRQNASLMDALQDVLDTAWIDRRNGVESYGSGVYRMRFEFRNGASIGMKVYPKLQPLLYWRLGDAVREAFGTIPGERIAPLFGEGQRREDAIAYELKRYEPLEAWANAHPSAFTGDLAWRARLLELKG